MRRIQDKDPFPDGFVAVSTLRSLIFMRNRPLVPLHIRMTKMKIRRVAVEALRLINKMVQSDPSTKLDIETLMFEN